MQSERIVRQIKGIVHYGTMPLSYLLQSYLYLRRRCWRGCLHNGLLMFLGNLAVDVSAGNPDLDEILLASIALEDETALGFDNPR